MAIQKAVIKSVEVIAASSRSAEVDVRYSSTPYGGKEPIPQHVVLSTSLWERGAQRRIYLDQAGRGGNRYGYWDVTARRYVPTERREYITDVMAAVAEAALAAIQAERDRLAAAEARAQRA